MINEASFEVFYLNTNKNLSKYFLREYFSGPCKLNINRTFSELKDEDALALAVRESDYDAIILLLWYGAKNVQYSFELALRICPKKIIKLILDHGGMLHRVIRPFEQVIMFNPHATSVIKWLLPRMSKRVRQDAFLFSCLKGDVGIAEILLQNGVDINKIGKLGQTALWNVLLSHRTEMVELLITYNVINNLTSAQASYMKGYFPAGYQRISELSLDLLAGD